MGIESQIVSPGPLERTVRTNDGSVLSVPAGWELLPPGDAGVTRRVKTRGPSWTVKTKKGRRVISLGVWASAETIHAVRVEFEHERATEAYKKRRASAARQRDRKQSGYVQDFRQSVVKCLDFDSCYLTLADRLADVVTAHATPVGSGTVARTERISIERRAESAVIAWLRHQTTAYDNMKIPRVKGKRREVRRMLAEESRRLLARYRSGATVSSEHCPLQIALQQQS